MIKSEYFGDLASARLRQEGWYQGRRVDITKVTQELIRHSHEITPYAVMLLESFHELVMENEGSGYMGYVAFRLWMDNPRYPYDACVEMLTCGGPNSAFVTLGEHLRVQLTPVATTNDAYLLCSEHGNIYLLDIMWMGLAKFDSIYHVLNYLYCDPSPEPQLIELPASAKPPRYQSGM
jgi:hypothetical protein